MDIIQEIYNQWLDGAELSKMKLNDIEYYKNKICEETLYKKILSLINLKNENLLEKYTSSIELNSEIEKEICYIKGFKVGFKLSNSLNQ